MATCVTLAGKVSVGERGIKGIVFVGATGKDGELRIMVDTLVVGDCEVGLDEEHPPKANPTKKTAIILMNLVIFIIVFGRPSKRKSAQRMGLAAGGWAGC